MIQNANLLPAGKTCPQVDGKDVLLVMHAVIDADKKYFKVLLADYTQGLVAESDLVTEGEGA